MKILVKEILSEVEDIYLVENLDTMDIEEDLEQLALNRVKFAPLNKILREYNSEK